MSKVLVTQQSIDGHFTLRRHSGPAMDDRLVFQIDLDRFAAKDFPSMGAPYEVNINIESAKKLREALDKFIQEG